MVWKIGGFVLITFLVSGLLAGLQAWLQLDFERIVLPQLAPAIGFFVLAAFMHTFRMPIVVAFDRSIALKSAVVLVLPVLLMALAFALGKGMGLAPAITTDVSDLLVVMLPGIFLGAIGEEIGWRSFLQGKLEKNMSAMQASIIVGLIWGLWHMGHYQHGFLFMGGFLTFTIAASIMIAWILRGTRYNLLLSTLFHVSVNIGFVVLFKNALTDAKLMIVHGVVWLIPALVVLIVYGRGMGK